ncbi:MAG: glycyl-radical enzyme activating protein [Aristaeellaceae bacterium]
METGTIFDIKEFSVFDGPGMRQTVFLKGCPLRCSWCHNPEGLSPRPQLMVSWASCVHCGRCREVCPHPEGCTACGRCVDVCPQNIRRIAGTLMTSEELARVVMKDAAYYARYGGGVTFSGGEPLLQAAFLIETLDRLQGVHRCIETSGFTDAETFRRVVERLDYVIMDLKLMDDSLHRRYTGVSNERILRNAEALMRSGKPCRFRVPLIPGVNDTEDNMQATAAFISSVNPAVPVELLPYHMTAGAKYDMIGKPYTPLFDVNRTVQVHLDLFKAYGLECSVL